MTPPATQLAGDLSASQQRRRPEGGFGLTVSVEDGAGNVVPSFNGNVTLALASDPGGGNLGGTLAVTAVNGVATFTGLTIDAASPNYSILASSDGLTDATTALVNVAPGALPHLAIFEEAGPVTAGSDFLVTVDVENAQGVTETNFAGRVTLTLASNPTGATLGGNLSMPVSDGQVTFYGLTLNSAGSGYTIRASSSGFATATTSPITVVNPPATQLVVIAQPPASVAANGDFGLTVAVVDAAGGLVSTFDGNVTVALVEQARRRELPRHTDCWGDQRRGDLLWLDVDEGPNRLHAPTDSQRTGPRVDNRFPCVARGGAPTNSIAQSPTVQGQEDVSVRRSIAFTPAGEVAVDPAC